MNATVAQGRLVKVIVQGVESLFEEQDDVLLLVCEVLQALIVLQVGLGIGERSTVMSAKRKSHRGAVNT